MKKASVAFLLSLGVVIAIHYGRSVTMLILLTALVFIVDDYNNISTGEQHVCLMLLIILLNIILKRRCELERRYITEETIRKILSGPACVATGTVS